MSKISIVTYCLNAEKEIPVFYQKLTNMMRTVAVFDYEWLAIDDNSKDHTIDILRNIRKDNSKVNVITHSEYIGKKRCLYSACKVVSGDYCYITNINNPETLDFIMEMVKRIVNYDVVGINIKADKPKHRLFKSFIKKTFNKNIIDNPTEIALFTYQTVDAIVRMQTHDKFDLSCYSNNFFNVYWLEYEGKLDILRKQKYSLFEKFNFYFDQLVSFSKNPLVLPSFLGFLITILEIINLVFKLWLNAKNIGFTVILIVLGLILMSFGLVNIYITKLFLEIKNNKR